MCYRSRAPRTPALFLPPRLGSLSSPILKDITVPALMWRSVLQQRRVGRNGEGFHGLIARFPIRAERSASRANGVEGREGTVNNRIERNQHKNDYNTV